MTGPGRDDIRDTLAAALRVKMSGLMWGRLNAAELADALTPVVRRIAADELGSSADGTLAAWDDQCGGYRNPNACESCRCYDDVITDLRRRAAALDPR